MNRLIIVGSPRIEGRSARLANQLFEACIEECPDDELALVPVSEVDVAGCTGCGACARLATGEGIEEPAADEPQKSKQAAQFDHPRRCAIDDDMGDIYELIDEAEELTVVSPVYFAGPPSQLKALLDRLQPYYERTAAERAAAAEEGRSFKTAVKPAVLHVVGEGSDPHGFAALVAIVQSALAVAGYRLETVLDWVGKIAPDGEILEEAEIIDLLDEDEDVYADVSVVFGPDDDGESDVVSGFAPKDEDEDADDPAASGYFDDDDFEGLDEAGGVDDFDDFDDEPAPARPQLRLNDTQVEERGRASEESGRSGGKRGRTDKRAGKGGSQTNNRNPRKENQAKARKRHASNAQGGKGAGTKDAAEKGHNARGASNKGASNKSAAGRSQGNKGPAGKGPAGKGQGGKGSAGKAPAGGRSGSKAGKTNGKRRAR